jgi:hypothetical protein
MLRQRGLTPNKSTFCPSIPVASPPNGKSGQVPGSALSEELTEDFEPPPIFAVSNFCQSVNPAIQPRGNRDGRITLARL